MALTHEEMPAPLLSSNLPDWQRDPDLFALVISGVQVLDEYPWRVRFRGTASNRIPRLVEALQFDRAPETLGELFALLGYGGMLHEALLRIERLPVGQRPDAIAEEVRVASTEYPADYGEAMLAYLTRDLVALSVIHSNYYPILVRSMGDAIDNAVRWFLDNADEAAPSRTLQ